MSEVSLIWLQSLQGLPLCVLPDGVHLVLTPVFWEVLLLGGLELVRICLKFLFLRKATMGGSGNVVLKLGYFWETLRYAS